MNLGKKINLARKRKGMTQAELGNLLGISEDAISAYERNKNMIPIDLIIRISLILELSPLELLGLDAFDKELSQKISLGKFFNPLVSWSMPVLSDGGDEAELIFRAINNDSPPEWCYEGSSELEFYNRIRELIEKGELLVEKELYCNTYAYLANIIMKQALQSHKEVKMSR